MSAAPATGAVPVTTPLLAMLGSADAAACEGDACLVPGAAATASDATADASAAADLARVRDAIDAGRAI
ncbi:hypothetical protein DOU11_12560 [Clavibacter michiganensis subsp. michiganensis]|uniref:hypothetical protein n=1 Tax=Clavibacter michiganensis TaxID=28447 RepID=UPI001365441A|nr:hypothetical protein [Clavibacter michiganensis]MWJ86455.1 hypothetical protein [Clavibacter michiganensis subsp. michiganensis]